MTIFQNQLFVIDSGVLYSGTLPAPDIVGNLPLSMTTLLTPTAQIDGFPVKEIVAVSAEDFGSRIAVLDKSNDIFIYNDASQTWSLHRPQTSNLSRPEPHYLNIATYAERLYLLDTSRNQIWRYPPNELGAAYLNGNLLWLQSEEEPNVTQGIDLAVDGTIYVLNRDGRVVQYGPDLLNVFSIEEASGKTHWANWEQRKAKPLSLYLDTDGVSMFIADPGRRRVVVLNRQDGLFDRQYIFADNSEFDRLHNLATKDDVLYMLAGNHLYIYPMKTTATSATDLARSLPEWSTETWDLERITLEDIPPNDPRVPILLNRYHLVMPNPGSVLPDQFVLYPGARRAYRYGVHQGMDLYYEKPDQRIVIGSPVLAAGGGVVVRADTDYREMTLEEVSTILADAHAKHITPPETLDKLGGRQIWIDHGKGLLTRYLHLDGIAEGITVGTHVESGQEIGYAGLSGTPDGIEGNLSFPHLHFEIRIGQKDAYYLGQWLTIEDTRRILEVLFSNSP
jgi:murein DD-endopeptidase MepM/ murein hydrolase activator NlpD